MVKTLLPFYLICFVLYVYFSRQPDYQDGEFTNGIIQYSISNNNQQPTTKAAFTVNKVSYIISAAYPFRNLTAGQKVSVIFDSSNPQNAAVYKWWGYWIQWDELVASILIPWKLCVAANAMTGDAAEEALMEDVRMDSSVKRRKYD